MGKLKSSFNNLNNSIAFIAISILLIVTAKGSFNINDNLLKRYSSEAYYNPVKHVHTNKPIECHDSIAPDQSNNNHQSIKSIRKNINQNIISAIDYNNAEIFINKIKLSRILQNSDEISALIKIYIIGTNGYPIPGAFVSTNYNGPTSGSASGLTNKFGLAEIITKATKKPVGTWCINVTNIERRGYIYNPGLDIQNNNICETNTSTKSVETVTDSTIVSELTMKCYPNPFTNIAHFKVYVPKDCFGNFEIYNSRGQLVERLMDQKLVQGPNIIVWHTSELKSGMYYCKLNIGADNLIITIIKAN